MRADGVNPLYWCCGMAEIGGFYRYNNVRDTKKKILSAMAKKWRPAYICTTIKRQRYAIKALRELKARPIHKFRNTNSGNLVTIWLKINESERPDD
jgi:hypothetical protein